MQKSEMMQRLTSKLHSGCCIENRMWWTDTEVQKPEGGYCRDLGRAAHAPPRAPPGNAGRLLTPPPRRRSACTPPATMADVSERTLQLSVLVAFASGVLVGWQANRMRRRYLDWRKRRLQDKLATTQKKLDLA
uniref:Small integral membrane protein 37 n=2 Tax=Otariidae TaxID=9702 RepID=A0A3Q7NS05_CALUR|nr:small integral membrane protein 37 [Callorhinus ursinus]